MPHNLIAENIVVNAQADTFARLCNEGYIRIKTKDNILLAELRLGDPAFQPAIKGILKANNISPEESAKETGKADRYIIYAQDGKTKLLTGMIGETGKGFDLELPSVEIIAGSQINIISFTHKVLKNANKT